MNTSKLSAIQTALLNAALQVQKNAYAPYSKYQVGAAILANNGKVYTGCNVENAAYPLGTCAEAGAISAMIADGGTTITEIMIVGPDNEPCYPCGGCRQKIAEFSDAATSVTLQADQSLVTTMTMAELLPAAFKLG